MFYNFPEISRRFYYVPKDSRRFQNVSDCFEMSQNILERPRRFLNNLEGLIMLLKESFNNII